MEKIVNNKVLPPIWLLFLLAGFPQFSETVYSPALPNISSMLQTDNHLVQWTLSIYFIGFALGVFLWGRWSDLKGRRFALLLGLIIYVIGSTICMIAQSINWLLIARLIQGLGASSGSVLSQTIARESLPENKRHQFFSAAGFAIAFSIAAGPFVGGYLTEWLEWRSNFALLVVVGVFLYFVTYLGLPETLQQSNTARSKVYEVFKMMIFDKHVLSCIWLVAAVNGILFSYYAEAPFIFIRILHLSESQFGWLGTLIAVAALLGSLASKQLVSFYRVNTLLAAGGAIMVISNLSLVAISLNDLIDPATPIKSTFFLMAPMMGIIFGGFGFLVPLALSTALQKYTSVLGTAGALFGFGYYVVIAMLTLIMGAIHNGTIYPMPIYFCVLSILTTLVLGLSHYGRKKYD